MPFTAWPPPEAEFYRPCTADTPVWQGDIFTDVPIVKAEATGKFAAAPAITIERRAVVVITYPCDLYVPRTADLSSVIAVVPLRDEAKRAGAIWRGHLDLCPLPDVLNDGAPHAALLQVPSTVDKRYLTPGNRVRSLSISGQAFLQQRLVIARTRLATPLGYHEEHLAPAEHERWLWERWVVSGGSQVDFVSWLDTPSPSAGGVRPRRWLEDARFGFLDGEAWKRLKEYGLTPAW